MEGHIYVVTHQTMDDEGAAVKASESLIQCQAYVMKRCDRILGSLGRHEYEVTRVKRGRGLDFNIHLIGDPFYMAEWFTIRPVKLIV